MLNPELPRPRNSTDDSPDGLSLDRPAPVEDLSVEKLSVEKSSVEKSSVESLEVLDRPALSAPERDEIDLATARGLIAAYRASAADRALRITELVRELTERDAELSVVRTENTDAWRRVADLEVRLGIAPVPTPAPAPALPRQRGSLLRRSLHR